MPVVPLRWVLMRDPVGQFQPQAFLCTDETVAPAQILQWFVLRWRLEVTFEETRRHLGVETQRQWTEKAIARTTPAQLGLFSWITLWAADLFDQAHFLPRQAAWYSKTSLTFADALAAVRLRLRLRLWWPQGFPMSRLGKEQVKIPTTLLKRLTDTLCYAA